MPKQPLASVALMVIGNDPVCVGVPERTPVAGLSVRPAGSVPLLSENVTGAMALPAGEGWLKATVDVAGFGGRMVAVIARQTIVRLVVAPSFARSLAAVGPDH